MRERCGITWRVESEAIGVLSPGVGARAPADFCHFRHGEWSKSGTRDIEGQTRDFVVAEVADLGQTTFCYAQDCRGQRHAATALASARKTNNTPPSKRPISFLVQDFIALFFSRCCLFQSCGSDGEFGFCV